MQAQYNIERLLIKSETIEIKIPKFVAGAGFKNVIPFPTSPNLRNSFILGMEAYYSEVLPLSTVSRTLTVIPLALMKVIMVNMQMYTGIIFINGKPLIDFKRKVSNFIGADAETSDFKNQYNVQFAEKIRLNWNKCNIDILDVTQVSDTVDQAVLLDVYYMENPEEEKAGRRVKFSNKK